MHRAAWWLLVTGDMLTCELHSLRVRKLLLRRLKHRATEWLLVAGAMLACKMHSLPGWKCGPDSITRLKLMMVLGAQQFNVTNEANSQASLPLQVN